MASSSESAGHDLDVTSHNTENGIARHLWRMCFALFFASSNFFLGQQKVMPASIRGSKFLYVPEIIVLGLMIFWLLRVLFTKTKTYKKGSTSESVEAVAIIP